MNPKINPGTKNIIGSHIGPSKTSPKCNLEEYINPTVTVYAPPTNGKKDKYGVFFVEYL
jgi:hypothetical protein